MANYAGYRKHNDHSHSSSTYHKKDGTSVRAILKIEAWEEIDETTTENRNMISALQTLKDNGLSTEALREVLIDLIDNDDIDDIDDVDEHQRIVVLEWYLGNEGDCDPDDCVFERNETVSISQREYRVLTSDEADAACAEYIVGSLWEFNVDFLAGETGINSIVFEALRKHVEDSNSAIRSIIDDSCGIAEFVDSAISAEGRGRFLAHYDCHETKAGNDWYIYRVN